MVHDLGQVGQTRRLLTTLGGLDAQLVACQVTMAQLVTGAHGPATLKDVAGIHKGLEGVLLARAMVQEWVGQLQQAAQGQIPAQQ